MAQEKVDKLKRILWLDLETTGLNKDRDRILEVAWRITTTTLGTYGPTVSAVVGDKRALRLMGDFVTDMHTKNGLIEEVAFGGIPLSNIEDQILCTMDEHEAGFEGCEFEWVIGGTGVATYDLPMLQRHMPDLHARLAYFTYDVGVVRRYWRDIFSIPLTDYEEALLESYRPEDHRAAGDVDAAFAEAKFYQSALERRGVCKSPEVIE